MIDLFTWGFVSAVVAMWAAVGVGAVILLLGRSPARRPAVDVEAKRAA